MASIALIEEGEKLADKIAKTYDTKRFAGVPRMALLDIQYWISTAWCGQLPKFNTKKQIAMANYLRSLAYEVETKQGEIVNVKPTANSRVAQLAVVPLMSAAMSMLNTSKVDAANKLVRFAQNMSLAWNGTHDDFLQLMTTVSEKTGMRKIHL